MHILGALSAAALLIVSASGPACAVSQAGARKATLSMVRPGACGGGRLLSHAAYLPTATGGAAQCGHMLSTDTLLHVHRWDKT